MKNQKLNAYLSIEIPDGYMLITEEEHKKIAAKQLVIFIEKNDVIASNGDSFVDELLEVTEVAKRLKCNKNKVYDLIKSRQLVGLKLGQMKVSTIELENFLVRNIGKDLTDPFNVKDLYVEEN